MNIRKLSRHEIILIFGGFIRIVVVVRFVNDILPAVDVRRTELIEIIESTHDDDVFGIDLPYGSVKFIVHFPLGVGIFRAVGRYGLVEQAIAAYRRLASVPFGNGLPYSDCPFLIGFVCP